MKLKKSKGLNNKLSTERIIEEQENKNEIISMNNINIKELLNQVRTLIKYESKKIIRFFNTGNKNIKNNSPEIINFELDSDVK